MGALLADLLVAVWVVGLASTTYAIAPAMALGRARGRVAWWPEWLAGCAWATAATVVLVPWLARFHLLNWATAVLVPFVWPIGLWLYRYRGAPSGEFRELCHRLTLRALQRRPSVHRLAGHGLVGHPFRGPTWCAIVGAAVVMSFWPALTELRFQTPADYDTLARARDLLAGGRWTTDPAASIVAVLSHVTAVDPMQVLRFLHPLLIVTCAAVAGVFVALATGSRTSGAMAAGAAAVGVNLPGTVTLPSTAAALGWLFLFSTAVLVLLALQRVHRRDWWHAGAASAIAMFACASANPAGSDVKGYVEYDGAARAALQIARGVSAGEWTIVAPPEQRVEVTDARAVIGLAEFVRRYGGRTGLRQFRFDLPARHLFVFVEKRPLTVEAGPALIAVSSGLAAGSYRLANARARLERAALDLCESYRQTHVGADIYYEDAQIRVYHFRR